MNFYTAPDNISLDLKNFNIMDTLSKRELNIETCPHCNCNKFIKHGYYKTLQRFKCSNHSCNKTFCATTNSPWSYSKKDFSIWKDYFKLMFENKTLEQCSSILEIHNSTAFHWRHKILYAMKTYLKPEMLKEFIEMNKYKFIENFKGCRNITTSKRENIWLISAVDTNTNILSELVSVGSISMPIIRDTIYKKIPKDAYIFTSSDTHLKAIERMHNKNLNSSHPKDKQLVRTFSKFISPWFHRFKGIATKYLNSYFTWYIITFKEHYADFLRFVENLTLENSFISFKKIKEITLTLS